MGRLVVAAEALPAISDSDDWERAVEALLLQMAEEIEGGVLRRADYTRKTQDLAEYRRSLTDDQWSGRAQVKARS